MHVYKFLESYFALRNFACRKLSRGNIVISVTFGPLRKYKNGYYQIVIYAWSRYETIKG